MDVRTYLISRALNKGGGGDITVEPLTVTENGQYAAPSGKAYSPVNVEVSGGGSGVVLSGTTAPTTNIGNNEDLYVQYSEHQGQRWTYVHGIDAIYRKVNGTWVSYVDPIDLYMAVHVWTQSTTGQNAAMYVQKVSYDPIAGTYTPVGDADIVVYTSVQGNTYDLFGLAELSYGPSFGPWKIVAKAAITDNVSTYNNGDTVTTWQYNQTKDIYLRYVV